MDAFERIRGERFDIYYEKASPTYPIDLGLGPTYWKCTLIDRKIGKKYVGWGKSKHEAYEAALAKAS